MRRSVVKRYFRSLMLLAGFIVLLATPALADPMVATPAVGKTRVFKVCLLLLESQTYTSGGTTYTYWNPDPWFPAVLNNSPYKPTGWVLDNPLAPARLQEDTELIRSGEGYGTLAVKGNGANWYTNTVAGETAVFNRPLTKNDPAYWVVKLDAKSIDALSQFDLIMLNGHNESTLSNTDRDNIQVLLNRGATIWLNNSQRDGAIINNFFTDPPIQFKPGPYTSGSPIPNLLALDKSSWLLNNIYNLSDTEVNYLRDNKSANSFIVSGVAGYDGMKSQIREIVRLFSPSVSRPAIAAGNVGNGYLIVTGTDIFGGTSDWWEYQHNNKTKYKDAKYMGMVPVNKVPMSENISQARSFVSCSKFVFNMLARPASWTMVGGNASAMRTFPRDFPASLTPSWSIPFNTLCDPVSYRNYVAVTGNSDGNGTDTVPRELRVMRTRRVTDNSGRTMDYPYGLYDQFGRILSPSWYPPSSSPTLNAWWTSFVGATTLPFFNRSDVSGDASLDTCFIRQGHWIGSPVFSTLTQTVNGKTATSTVLYALNYDDTANTYVPYCFVLDPYFTESGQPNDYFSGQAGSVLWAGTPMPAEAAIGRASMTLSSNRLVITLFGKSGSTTAEGVNDRILLYDASTGIQRVAIAATPAWRGQFRLTGPASITTAQIEMTMNRFEAGDPSGFSSQQGVGYLTKTETLEVLAVTGEVYGSAIANTSASMRGASALFLIPPMLLVRTPTNRESPQSFTPDMSLNLSDGTSYTIGNPTDPFRLKNIVSIKAAAGIAKITLRSWDVFFPKGTATKPELDGKLPMSLTYTGRAVVSRTGTSTTTGSTSKEQLATVTVPNLIVSMGYPILVSGSFGYDMVSRSTLRINDGDALDTFGYHVDAPPLVSGDNVIIGTNSGSRSSFPFLKQNQQIYNPNATIAFGGSLTAYRIANPVMSRPIPPLTNWTGEIAWQFFGNNLGPVQAPPPSWANGSLLAYWRSDFPYPPAADKEAVYTTATYNGLGNITGEVNTEDQQIELSMPYRGAIYALDPAPSRYLEQTVAVGRIVDPTAVPTGTLPDYSPDSMANFVLQLTAPSGNDDRLFEALRVGARALLSGNGATWDLGRVRLIRLEEGKYWVVFDRQVPDRTNATWVNSTLLVATSTPFVSHVIGWDAVTGAEPVTENRISQGICSSYPKDKPANPDPDPSTVVTAETMISFTELGKTCHIPNHLTGTTATPHLDSDPYPTGFETAPFLYLPRIPFRDPNHGVGSTDDTNINYFVDCRTGRIELSPVCAGRFADRFVVIHYYTNETTGKVRHSEVMHVPTQVKWEYFFRDAIPDSGPVLVNDVLYVSAQQLKDGKWQPALYAFNTHPKNPLEVEPAWIRAVGNGSDNNLPLPYRGITTPTPTAGGIVVGTAVRGAKNTLNLFADQGLLVADGHRVVRLNADGEVTWQASATKSPDPAVFNSGADELSKSVAQLQQEFRLLTKIDRLPNGNILACDTGGNRVVEFDRTGEVVWQYPDSDLTCPDPYGILEAYHVDFNAIRKPTPVTMRLNGPRDVRRFTTETRLNIINRVVSNTGEPNATLRWDITLITDPGNNRILEVYRPMIAFDDLSVQGAGFYYRPDISVGATAETVYDLNGTAVAYTHLRQFAEVLADGADETTVRFLGKPVNYTLATSCPLPSANDETLTASSILNRVRTKTLLAVIGTPVPDPGDTKFFLHTVMLSRSEASKKMNINSTPGQPVNALRIRPNSPNDYSLVRQLDIVRLREEPHVLVVDQVGVREVPLALNKQLTPVFEMRQTEYAAALLDAAGWGTLLQDWRSDRIFAPVAVKRIDSGSGSTADCAKVRYLISQMSTLVNPAATAIRNPDNANIPMGARRIHVFEATYTGPPAYDPRGWGIIDAHGDFTIYPNPLSAEYPNLPGTYPLSQPFSLDLD